MDIAHFFIYIAICFFSAIRNICIFVNCAYRTRLCKSDYSPTFYNRLQRKIILEEKNKIQYNNNIHKISPKILILGGNIPPKRKTI